MVGEAYFVWMKHGSISKVSCAAGEAGCGPGGESGGKVRGESGGESGGKVGGERGSEPAGES